jgi:hypothetical protein
MSANTSSGANLVKKPTITSKPKPDNEVSETTRKRRAAKKKKHDDRKRAREARERWIEYLKTNGRERPEGRCQPCEDGGHLCIISIDPTPKRYRCLRCVQSNKLKCSFPVLEAAVPKMVAPSRERKLPHNSASMLLQVYSPLWFQKLPRTENLRVLVELINSDNRYLASGTPRLPGPCRPCFKLGLPCLVIKEGSLASKLSKSIRCSNCLDESTRHRMNSQLKESFGCCDVPEGYVFRVCGPAAPTIVSNPSATNTTKVTLKSGDTEIRKTMTVPLKSPEDVKTTLRVENLRRHSRRLQEKLFPDMFEDDPVSSMPPSLNDITDLSGELYQFIEDLSFAVDAFHKARSSSPLPFSLASLLELGKLPTEDPSLPTITEAIKQGLGIEGSLTAFEVSDQIRQFGLNSSSLFTVLPLITSILVHNLIMEVNCINPFSRSGIATRTEIVLTSIRSTIPPQELGKIPNWEEKFIEQFHLASLSSICHDRDPQLSKQLDGIANAAGEKLFQIIKPLLTLGLTTVAESKLNEFREICLSITAVATRLNAQLVPRRGTNQITLFWPYPGQNFDYKLHNPHDTNDYTVGEIRKVLMARFWGIKMRDYESGKCCTLAKSECDIF